MNINILGKSALRFIAVLPWLLITPETHANAGIFELSLSELLEIEITTASRTPQSQAKTLAPVTVITRQDIEQSHALTLPELLAGLPGVHVATSGGFGSATSIFMRGTDSGHVLILVDGIKVESATLGQTNIQYIPLDHIERIEMVRGPRSSLYGSEAIGGVIQIFTRSAGNMPSDTNYLIGGKLGYGANNTSTAFVDIKVGNQTTNLRVNAANLDTDSYNEKPLSDPDEDSFDSQSAGLAFQHQFINGAEFNLSGWQSRGNKNTDGCNFFSIVAECNSDFLMQGVRAQVKYSPTKIWHTEITAGEGREEDFSYRDAPPRNIYISKQRQLLIQNDIQLHPDHLVTVGLDHLDSRVESTVNYMEDQRKNFALFTQWQASVGNHNLLFGLRGDDSDAFGRINTNNFAWGYQINSDLRITASYGSAFKGPSFNDLYFPNFGNPNLKPEKSESWEFNIQHYTNRGIYSLNMFHTSITDLIAFVDLGGGVFAPFNIDQSTINGLEASASLNLRGWKNAIYLTLISPKEKDSGNLLARRSEQTIKLSSSKKLDKWHVGGSIIAQSHSFNDTSNSIRMGGYSVTNLWAIYSLSDHWYLKVQIGNLFDKKYQTADGFNTLERSGQLTIGLN